MRSTLVLALLLIFPFAEAQQVLIEPFRHAVIYDENGAIRALAIAYDNFELFDIIMPGSYLPRENERQLVLVV